jgi:hypothetical protein
MERRRPRRRFISQYARLVVGFHEQRFALYAGEDAGAP